MYVDAMVWYFVFIIFIMYCIMPMPFKWCITTCIITSPTHIFCISVVTLTDMSNQPISYSSVSSLFVMYLGVNWLGLYTKYLTERAQRKAFLETRHSLETRFKAQKENDIQEKLLLSVLPSFVPQHMIRSLGELIPSQFHKIYIHRYEKV